MKRNWMRLSTLSLLLPAAAWGALATPSTIYRQGALGILDVSETNDKFGYALAAGNFNGDGFVDLAIGAPGENAASGAAHVLYGTSNGLVATAQLFFNQTMLSINGGDELSESGDSFGASVCTGDFNGDGFDDLAIGAPVEKLGTTVAAGMVSIVYGGELGIDLTTRTFLSRDTPGVESASGTNESFGASCASGDFNHDSYDDLAVGVTGQTVISGAVHVLYGSSDGISTSGDKIFRQGTSPAPPVGNYTVGLPGTSMLGGTSSPRDNERFGASLAVGKFDGDNYDDLAIGVPNDEFSQGISWISAGGFHMVFGSNSGLTDAGNLYFNAATSYIPGTLNGDDQLGTSLAAGRFDADSYDDLVVGSPGKDFESGSTAGVAIVLFGRSNRTHIANAQTGVEEIKQGAGGILDAQELNDKFGQSLVAGRYPEGSPELDYLVVGATGEAISGFNKTGSLNVIYAADTGLLDSEENQFFNQNVPNFGDACEANDQLGLGLTSGDFNGDGSPDLAIGVPEEDLSGAVTNSGIVQVLYFPGQPVLFADDFSSGDLTEWSDYFPLPALRAVIPD